MMGWDGKVDWLAAYVTQLHPTASLQRKDDAAVGRTVDGPDTGAYVILSALKESAGGGRGWRRRISSDSPMTIHNKALMNKNGILEV